MKLVDVTIILIAAVVALLLSQEFLRAPVPSEAVASSGRSPASLSPGEPARSSDKEEPYQPRLEGFSAALEELGSCYDRQNCNFPRTDEKSYDFAVGQAMRGELFGMAEWVEAHHIRDGAVSVIANAYLAVEDGHVQEAALALLATQPTSSESLEILLSKVIAGHDAQLIKQALRELERYEDFDDRRKIAVALADAMVTGSPFVAKEISASFNSFLDAGSVRIFEDAAYRLPAKSVVRANVAAALKEFRD